MAVNWRVPLLFALVLIALQALVLHLEGHSLLSASGHLYFWEGNVTGSENSQQLTDWYTFSHIIHGFLFYCLFWFLFPKLPVAQRLLMALGVEIAWEIIENTPWLIDQYRQQALAQGYNGDSIINSISDTCAMACGFFMASRLPVWITVMLGVVMEAFVGFSIRDNLTLNVLGFFHHFDFISRWQLGR